jgi:Organic radical activating enzymes
MPASTDRTVVITGGEPLMWDMGPLTEGLKARGFQVHLETSGAYPLTGSWDWVCLSPKKNKSPKPEWYALANELKVIVFNDDDFKWAEKHSAQCGPQVERFLQPEWSRRDQNVPKIVAYLESPARMAPWPSGPQVHRNALVGRNLAIDPIDALNRFKLLHEVSEVAAVRNVYANGSLKNPVASINVKGPNVNLHVAGNDLGTFKSIP